SPVVQGDFQLRGPVLRSRLPKGQEHRLEQGAALVTAFKFLRRYVQAAHLQPQAIYQRLNSGLGADRRQVLVKHSLGCAARVTSFGVCQKYPTPKVLGFVGAQVITPLVPVVRDGDEQKWRRQQRRAVYLRVAGHEVQRELHAFYTLLPSLLQFIHRQAPDRLEARLPRSERHQVLQVDAQLQLETRLGALGLERLEGFQRTAPFGRDLRKREIRAAQLGTQRVDAHEDLGHLVVGH